MADKVPQRVQPGIQPAAKAIKPATKLSAPVKPHGMSPKRETLRISLPPRPSRPDSTRMVPRPRMSAATTIPIQSASSVSPGAAVPPPAQPPQPKPAAARPAAAGNLQRKPVQPPRAVGALGAQNPNAGAPQVAMASTSGDSGQGKPPIKPPQPSAGKPAIKPPTPGGARPGSPAIKPPTPAGSKPGSAPAIKPPGAAAIKPPTAPAAGKPASGTAAIGKSKAPRKETVQIKGFKQMAPSKPAATASQQKTKTAAVMQGKSSTAQAGGQSAPAGKGSGVGGPRSGVSSVSSVSSPGTPTPARPLRNEIGGTSGAVAVSDDPSTMLDGMAGALCLVTWLTAAFFIYSYLQMGS